MMRFNEPIPGRRWGARPRFVVVGIAGGRRVELFQAALGRRGIAPALLVPWIDVIDGRADLRSVVRADDVVRIESPGKDFEVEKALLRLGASAGGRGGISARDVDALRFERGRILCLGQWYRGFEAVLLRVAAQLADSAMHRLMAEPSAILCMFDKPACHARLRGAGVAVPPALGPVESYNELVQRMNGAGWSRVFVKPAHGSSASGVVAYQTNGRDCAATTAVEMVRSGGELRLYNSRCVRTYRDRREIAMLIDALCAHRVHVERWLPKAGIDGRAFDLRVVVIGGRARHVVVRTSRTPMTNLHLLNQRGDAARVRGRVGETAWGAAMETCERTMRCFPRSLHGGVDLLIGTDLRAHAVLEVNAFGDLLPGVTCDALDTYEAEIEEVLARDEPAPVTSEPVALAGGSAA